MRFWDILKGDIMAAMVWFREKKELSDWCNASFLILIPELPNSMGLNNFRSISLIGILYKIISKILMERMKMVMGKLISKEQSAFLRGRSILDGMLVANEMVEFLKRVKKEKA